MRRLLLRTAGVVLRHRTPLQQQQCTRARNIHISSVPSSHDPDVQLDVGNTARNTEGPDAQFEILGRTSSLLSATISASQPLYTRKGTLIGFNGSSENTTSKLSLLEPIRRAAGGIPFLYQKIVSTSPFSVLIAAKSAATSYSIVHLDGRIDWMVAQRNALLAWTGHSLSLRPHVNASMGLTHWGRTSVTGRGLLCLSGKGNIYQLSLKTGDEYVVHPSNVVAYAMMRHAPQPYRFKTSTMSLQVPSLASRIPDTRLFRTMRQSTPWRFIAGTAFTIRTWFRRSVMGDRLFLRFEGPANIILQSRGNALRESLSPERVDEVADAPAGAALLAANGHGVALSAPGSATKTGTATDTATRTAPTIPTKMTYANVQSDGTVKFDNSTM